MHIEVTEASLKNFSSTHFNEFITAKKEEDELLLGSG